MSRNKKELDYFCNGCGRLVKRSGLTVKRAQFTSMGVGARTLRTRVLAWLCEECVQVDKDWNLPEGRTVAERGTRLVGNERSA